MFDRLARMRWLTAVVLAPGAVLGQQPIHAVSRSEAIASAVARGARLGVARADTLAASAQLITARALQNPALSASYSKSTPQYHVTMEVPIDLPALRRARIGSARAARTAADYRFAFERAAVMLDADTTYTRALAAREHARLSRRNAQEADSLRRIAVRRRDEGDASDMDVELATVNAGQAENIAASDSLTFLSAVLDLQAAMGIADRSLVITPSDSLTDPPVDDTPARDTTPTRADQQTLPVAAARAEFQAATLGLRVQRRSIFTAPSVMFGIETGDPTGSEPGILPTFGIGLPLPFFNRNAGPIAQAEAERLRAQSELTLATVESRTEIARTRRELAIAVDKVRRDRALVTSANRVAAMSLTAYREGAAPLATVLEAQRNSRDVLAQYVDDLAAAWIATAELRVLTLTPGSNAL